MSTWYSKEVGDGVAAFNPTGELFRAFSAAQAMNEFRSNMAVFSNYDLNQNVVTWYFTPESQKIADNFEAAPCQKPSPVRGFGLLVGDYASWNTYFPGYIESVRGRQS